MSKAAYIVSAVRTPTGKFGGGLAEFTAADLGVIAVRAALERAFGETPPERAPGVSAAQETEVGTQGRPSLGVSGEIPRSAWRARNDKEKLSKRAPGEKPEGRRSEEHTSELQSLRHLVCGLVLEKKNNKRMRCICE